MGEIIVSTNLGSALSEALERQVSLQLGGFESKIHTLHAKLDRGDEVLDTVDAGGQMRRSGQQYQCAMEAELVSGTRLSVIIVNTDPKVCISDAAARLKRSVSRKIRRFETTERAVPAHVM